MTNSLPSPILEKEKEERERLRLEQEKTNAEEMAAAVVESQETLQKQPKPKPRTVSVKREPMLIDPDLHDRYNPNATRDQIRDAIVATCTGNKWLTAHEIIVNVRSQVTPLIPVKDDVVKCLEYWRATNSHPYRVDTSSRDEYRLVKIKCKVPDIKYLQQNIEGFIPLIEDLIRECQKDRASISYSMILSYASKVNMSTST